MHSSVDHLLYHLVDYFLSFVVHQSYIWSALYWESIRLGISHMCVAAVYVDVWKPLWQAQ